MGIKSYIRSSMDTIFYDSSLYEDSFDEIKILKNQPTSFQMAYLFENEDEDTANITPKLTVNVESEISDYVSLYSVENVGANVIGPALTDDWYLSRKPGMYPDVCKKVKNNIVRCVSYQWGSLWVNINEEKENLNPGEYDIKISLKCERKFTYECEKTVRVKVIDDTVLPHQRYVTNWMHYDCISYFSDAKPFSKKFYKAFKSYATLASKNGQNTVLFPAFTPALDTEVGCERMTAQLVNIEKTDKGYVFDFSKAKEFVDICRECGIKYFEHCHFFTQWGAKAAPKIVVKVNGKNKKLFGWHTNSIGVEYFGFLKEYIKAFKKFMKENKLTDSFVFHVSDEPHLKHMETYGPASEFVHKELKGYIICDALADYGFYESKVVTTPVAVTTTADDFIGKADDMWIYFTGGVTREYLTNRIIGIPYERQRILGVQMYYFGIKGFLQWGFNAHHTFLCKEIINPYISPDMNKEFLAGTSYLVYPEKDYATPSVRLFIHRETFNDISLLEKLESMVGRERVIEIIEEAMPGINLRYRVTKEQFDTLYNKVIEEIEKSI